MKPRQPATYLDIFPNLVYTEKKKIQNAVCPHQAPNRFILPALKEASKNDLTGCLIVFPRNGFRVARVDYFCLSPYGIKPAVGRFGHHRSQRLIWLKRTQTTCDLQVIETKIKQP